jgi:hypothetical protein
MVTSIEGDNLIVYFYISASEIWPDKRGWPLVEKRGTTISRKQLFLNHNVYS